MSKFRLLLTVSLVWCALWPSPAHAQQETATITGTVSDASGADRSRSDGDRDQHSDEHHHSNAGGRRRGLRDPQPAAGRILGHRRERRVSRKPSARASRCRSRRSRASTSRCRPGSSPKSWKSSERRPLLDTQTSSRGLGHRPEEDRRAAAERPRLQPARAALARRPAGHAAAGERQLQGRAQRQRQPHVQQRVPARRRGQHLVLELVSRRERPARAAVDRGAPGIQDPDERVFGRVRPQLRRRRERGDQVGDE